MSEENETLVERIGQKSEAEAASLLATARRVAEREVQSAERRAATRERVARRELDDRMAAMKARAQAEADSQALRMKLTRRHELAQRIMADAIERLAAQPRDDSYLRVLTTLAREAAAALSAGEAIALVRAGDREFLADGGRFDQLAAAVKEETGAALTLSDDTLSVSGGVVLVTGDGKVSYYNTFEEIAYRMGPQLRQMIAEELFG